MAVLQGGGQNPNPPCVCYPKDPCGIGLRTSKPSLWGIFVWSDLISHVTSKTSGSVRLVRTHFLQQFSLPYDNRFL